MDPNVEPELRDAGTPEDLVPELVTLAQDIEQLPTVQPSRTWLIQSKWRLLRRFDDLQSDAPADSDPSRTE